MNRNELKTRNCLVGDNLFANTVLYVPPVATSTVQGCSIGATGWIKNYTVKSGDTIYAIATNYNTTANLLKSVNCHPSDLIHAGELCGFQRSHAHPTPTLLPGSTATPYPTDRLTETALPFTFTAQPSNTPVPPTATPPQPPHLYLNSTASMTAFP
ncbi:MAG: LysM peptidoglycan-binding domain-containing protein [Anaerolineales bacterium]|nr:LysM peptidoglycan-binding domain-containing protein [Anaerolineales bacterium]